MSDERDETIERVAAALRPLPEVRDEARARVLVAVAAEREAQRERGAQRRGRAKVAAWVVAATGVAAAFLVVVRMHGGGTAPVAPATPLAVAPGSGVPATLATNGADAASAPVAVQLMLHAPAARRVRLVGDFTGWDARGVEMRRDSASGLWSGVAAVRPGGHVYAFIVDDSTWVRDPRAPVAPDSDFGKPGSLLIVGRP